MPKIGLSELAPALQWPKYFYQGFNRQYFRKVLAERPIAYWPLWEAAGSVAYDISGNAFHGAYNGVTLGQDGIGDGRSCPLFGGDEDYVNIYSTGLRDAFNGAEGTIIIWAKVFNVGVWTDGANTRRCYELDGNADNQVRIYKSANNNMRWVFRAGGETDTVDKGSLTTTDWMFLAYTWSKSAAGGDGQAIAYFGGARTGAIDTPIGTWAGTLKSTATLIGASGFSSGEWYGYLAHAAFFDSAKSATVMASLAVV